MTRRLLLTATFLLLPIGTFLRADVFTDDEVATTVSMKEVDTMPKPVKQTAPEVPGELRGQTGTIQVGFLIDEKGNVVNPRIAKSTNDELNEIATKTVGTWKFKAAEKGGKPVPVRVIVPLRFK